MKELIVERNVEVNARNDHEQSALRIARLYDEDDVAAYLVSHGGIE